MIHRHGDFTEQITIPKHTPLVTTTVRHPSGLEATAQDENVYWSRAMAWREMAVKLAESGVGMWPGAAGLVENSETVRIDVL